MRLTRTLFSMWPALALLPIFLGCGGVEIILKSPVESQCGSAGLKGCPELTSGVLIYVEGDEVKGKAKLLKGAAENAPANVRKFAAALKDLNKIPGTGAYMKTILKIADILASAPGAEAGPGAPVARGGGRPGAPDDATGPRENGVVSPATSRSRVSCGPMAAYGSCMWVVAGPMVLTELSVDPTCPAEMAAGAVRFSGALELPRWVAVNPHGLGGQRSMVRRGESLFLGVAGPGANDPRCSLTWSGFRPDDGR